MSTDGFHRCREQFVQNTVSFMKWQDWQLLSFCVTLKKVLILLKKYLVEVKHVDMRIHIRMQLFFTVQIHISR